jgi:hypothetical protein
MVSADYHLHKSFDLKRTWLSPFDSLLPKNPDQVQRLSPATPYGRSSALENPGVIGTYIRTYSLFGWVKRETRALMTRTVRTQGDLKRSLKVDALYTMPFLKEMYGK